MIYALFTDSTFRTSNSFVESFRSEAAFERACENQAGYYDGKVISEEEYKAAHTIEDEMLCPHCNLTFEEGCDCISPKEVDDSEGSCFVEEDRDNDHLFERWPSYGE